MSAGWRFPVGLALAAIAWLGCGVQYENERPSRYLSCHAEDDGHCECRPEISIDPDATRCSAVSAGGVCCASASWPGSGSCQCLHVACAATAVGCSCAAGTPGDASQCTGSFTTCCLDPDRHDCVCSSAATCGARETQVQACNASLFTCSLVGSDLETDVDHCSEGPVAE